MADRPIPILYVHHRPELGGAPQSLSYLLRHLDREAFAPYVFCPPGPAAELFRRAGAVPLTGAVSNFTHIWASTYRGRRWLLFLRELARLPRHLADFRRALRAQPFELVHLNDAPAIVAALIARRAGVPIVWHLRSALPGDGRDTRSRLMRQLIRRLSEQAIAITEDVARSYDVDALVVPNSVDLELFTPSDAREGRARLGLPPETPVVTFFGFLYPSKGFSEFIEAAALVRDRGIDVQFLVVGGAVRGEQFFQTPSGRMLLTLRLARNYDVEARSLVAELELGDWIRFVPFTRDTSRYYAASDIVVAPSRGLELGRPVIEAAASGVPVIATGSRTGGGIVVPGETGLLLPMTSPAALADAVVALLRDPARARRIGSAARERAEREFEPATQAAKIQSVYRRILPEGRPTPILFVHHRPQLGGAPLSLAELIRHLDKERWEPHVLVPGGKAAELFADAGARVHVGPVAIFKHPWDSPYDGVHWLLLVRELAVLAPHVRRMGELIRRYRFPIVHVNDSPLLPAAGVAHRHGTRVVWHLRSALYGDGLDRRSRMISRLMERWGDAAIAIDRDVADRFRIRLPLAIVHNSVRISDEGRDPEDAKNALGLRTDRVAIGFAGFIRRPKGWPELVRAAELLVRSGTPAQFVIVGGGVRPPEFFGTLRGRTLAAANLLVDEESALLALVRAKGLEDYFSFMPFTADTGDVYRALDVVTFPNQGVGLGRPVLEAAAYGKPVVASGSRTGAGILLPGRTGILLDDPTPAAIAGALKRLVEDGELRRRLGTAAAEHARASFDPIENARRVERLYDEMLGAATTDAQMRRPRGERSAVG
ncbi:MAG TPA: glycosyltransferase family 4 protein [Gaiellaceae bacterium]|nr:glycosyltransferase family 4 protein [Gaiellaceae bacterium]